MSYILLSCQIILAAILSIAAFGKVRYTQQFVTALRASVIPSLFVLPTAIIIIILEAELALGLALSIHGMLPFIFGSTFLLLGAFTGWLISVYRRQLNVECGCFGASRAKVGKSSIIRNILLMVVSLSGFFLALHASDILPTVSLWTFVISAITVGAIIIVLCNRHMFKHLYQRVSTSHLA
jgi:hypothetical protein